MHPQPIFGPKHVADVEARIGHQAARWVVRMSLPALCALGTVGCFGGGTPTEPEAAPTPTHPLPSRDEDVGRAIATINGRAIGTVGLDRARGLKRPAQGGVFDEDEKKAFLSEAIDEELLFQEAFERGLYRELPLRRAMIAAVLKADVYDALVLPEHPDDAMRTWFKDHREDFIIPERVHIQRIFLVPGASRSAAATRDLIDSLRAQALKDPEQFPELAREHSDGPLALRSGDAGFVSREGRPEVPPAVVDAAFKLDPGTISEPFEHGGGWNLVRVVDRRERIDRTFEQVRSTVKRRMNEEVIHEKRQALAERLRAEAEVSVDGKALSSWRPALVGGRSQPGAESKSAPAEPDDPQEPAEASE